MNSGKLDRQIIIQGSTHTTNDYGESVNTFANLYTVWAAVEPVSAQETFEEAHLQDSIDTRFRLRYLPSYTLSTKNRIVYNSASYNIQSVVNVGNRNRELIVMAKRIVA